MNVVILSAGEASRMPDAPYGCKSLVMVNDQTVLEWQLASLPDDTDATIVCLPAAQRQFDNYDVEVVVHDKTNGPTRALLAAEPSEPTLVIFADTLFTAVPTLDETWIGVGLAHGGRIWEYTDEYGIVRRHHIPPERCRAVHVGMYYFDDPEFLIEHAWGPWHVMLSNMNIRAERRIPGWMDVGDETALAYAQEHWLDL